MRKSPKFFPEVVERAVCLVFEAKAAGPGRPGCRSRAAGRQPGRCRVGTDCRLADASARAAAD